MTLLHTLRTMRAEPGLPGVPPQLAGLRARLLAHAGHAGRREDAEDVVHAWLAEFLAGNRMAHLDVAVDDGAVVADFRRFARRHADPEGTALRALRQNFSRQVKRALVARHESFELDGDAVRCVRPSTLHGSRVLNARVFVPTADGERFAPLASADEIAAAAAGLLADGEAVRLDRLVQGLWEMLDPPPTRATLQGRLADEMEFHAPRWPRSMVMLQELADDAFDSLLQGATGAGRMARLMLLAALDGRDGSRGRRVSAATLSRARASLRDHFMRAREWGTLDGDELALCTRLLAERANAELNRTERRHG